MSQGDRRQAGGGLLALASGADERDARPSRACPHPRDMDEKLSAGGAVRRDRPTQGRARGAAASRDAPHERQSARQWRRALARSEAARLSRLCGRRAFAWRCDRGGDTGHGPVPARRDEAQSGIEELPPVQPGREQFKPLAGRARSHEPRLGRRDLSLRRSSRRRRAGDGDAERASVPGLARRLPADRPARLLLLLRGLHPHCRFHVQPACEVAQGLRPYQVAPPDRLAQLSLVASRLASGPQRLFAPGPRLHRSRDEQEGRGGAHLFAAGRELPAVRHRPLPEEPQLRERHRRGKTALAAMADAWTRRSSTAKRA